jgi:hypothetical protein
MAYDAVTTSSYLIAFPDFKIFFLSFFFLFLSKLDFKILVQKINKLEANSYIEG